MAKKQAKKTPDELFAEKQEKYANEVLKALEKNPDIYQFCDLPLIIPKCRATLYNYQLDKLDSIKEKLADNKMKFKRALRLQMKKTNNPTCLIALYKLLANDEEKDALNNKPKLESNNDNSTQEAFLKHLKELGNNAD